jgi:hypothetical protein
MRHLVYSVRYSVLAINSSLLDITLCCAVRTILFYGDTKYFLDFINVFISTNFVLHLTGFPMHPVAKSNIAVFGRVIWNT